MTLEPTQTLSKLVIFEGVDGVGKTTLAEALAAYYEHLYPQVPIFEGSFPGAGPGTLGEWVYRVHHAQIEGLQPESIAPPALQLLHVAGHVDAIESWIGPSLKKGSVILDRYWWSTYAYARVDVSAEIALALVVPEQPFWRSLAQPIIFYVTRTSSLKSDEVDQERHELLDCHYREIIERERESGVEVHEVANDGELDDSWRRILDCLGLPYAPIAESIRQ